MQNESVVLVDTNPRLTLTVVPTEEPATLINELYDIAIADVADDVSCSFDTLHYRNRRTGEIEGALGLTEEDMDFVWFVAATLTMMVGHYASGLRFP